MRTYPDYMPCKYNLDLPGDFFETIHSFKMLVIPLSSAGRHSKFITTAENYIVKFTKMLSNS